MSALMQLTAARARAFLREPGALVWAALFPVGAALIMAYLSSRGQLDRDRATATIAVALCMGNLWGIGWAVAHARMGRLFRQLLLTPAPPWKLLAPFVAQRLVQSLAEGLCLAAVASALLPGGLGVSWPLLTVAIALTGLSFAAIGLLAASRVQSVESTIGWLNLASLPFVLLSGLVVPTADLPDAAQSVAAALPVQQFVAMAAAGSAGEALAHAGAIALFALVATALSLWSFRWR